MDMQFGFWDILKKSASVQKVHYLNQAEVRKALRQMENRDKLYHSPDYLIVKYGRHRLVVVRANSRDIKFYWRVLLCLDNTNRKVDCTPEPEVWYKRARSCLEAAARFARG